MFKVNFMANQSVTDEDINAIGYNLSNTVYTTFENGVTYGIDALNEITKNIVGKGVKREYGDMCAVLLDGTTVTIHSGQAFFENGATMTIDEDGISLELEDATVTNYVYLFHNTALNVAGARCTTEIPSGIDVILLAEITDGVANQNLERFCKSKVLDAPNTPLVVYNNTECEMSDSEQKIVEIIKIPNLRLYTMARIQTPEFYYESSGVGHQSWIYKPNFVEATVDFGSSISPKPISQIYFNGRIDSYGQYFTSESKVVCGDEIDIGYYTYKGYSNFGNANIVVLKFDFDKEEIVISYDSPVKTVPGSIRIELFAGEVQ